MEIIERYRRKRQYSFIKVIVFLTNRKDYLHSDTRKNFVLSEVEGKDGCVLLNGDTVLVTAERAVAGKFIRTNEELHQLRWK